MTTNRPLSLVLVSREYPPFFGGGIGTYARWIVPALADAGVRVHVITETADRTHPRIETNGRVTTHRVPLAIGRGGWTGAAIRFSIHAGRRVTELAHRGEADVVEFAECEAAGAALLALRHARSTPRVPTLVHLHTPSEQLFKLRSLAATEADPSLATYFVAERLAMRWADRIGAPSRFIAEWAQAHYGFDETPAVIPYAIAPLPELSPPPREPNVLFIGRIEPRKGVEPLILAWKRVLAQHPSAVLRLAGADSAGAPDGGSLRAYLNTLLEDHERNSVRFLGRLNAESLRDEYRAAALCVIPSLWENFPNTCIESMSHGRAVLVSDHGGMTEMIGDTNAGERFATGDVDDLAHKLSSMLSEGVKRLTERGAVARERIASLCDPRRVAEQRVGLFHDTIERARARRTAGPAAATLEHWRQAERALAGDVADLDLPDPKPTIARWVDAGAGAAGSVAAASGAMTL